jgi:subtilisin family serine protease
MSLSRSIALTASLLALVTATGCSKSATATLGFAAGASVAVTQEPDTPPAGAEADEPSVRVVPGADLQDEIVVGIEPGHRAVLAADESGITKVREFDMGLHFQRLKLPKGMSRDEAMKKLAGQAGVKMVAPIRRYATNLVPNDARYSEQWGMHANRANAEAAWDRHVDASGVTVAVIDTGVDYTHPDLRGRVVLGPNLIHPGQPPMDDHGHGTHVAGIIGASGNDGQGVCGVAWNCKIMAIKALDNQGGGDSDNIVAGMKYAADNGAKVINLSLGTTQTAIDAYVHYGMTYCASKGVTVVAAAGNEHGPVTSPANDPVAIAVSSTSSFWLFEWISTFSNYGEKVEVAAPGGGILSTLPVNGAPLGKLYGKLSGTSMAAPFVAGEAALIVARHPGWTPDQIRARIDSAVVDKGAAGRDTKYGFGRVDLAKALD